MKTRNYWLHQMINLVWGFFHFNAYFIGKYQLRPLWLLLWLSSLKLSSSSSLKHLVHFDLRRDSSLSYLFDCQRNLFEVYCNVHWIQPRSWPPLKCSFIKLMKIEDTSSSSSSCGPLVMVSSQGYVFCRLCTSNVIAQRRRKEVEMPLF